MTIYPFKVKFQPQNVGFSYVFNALKEDKLVLKIKEVGKDISKSIRLEKKIIKLNLQDSARQLDNEKFPQFLELLVKNNILEKKYYPPQSSEQNMDLAEKLTAEDYQQSLDHFTFYLNEKKEPLEIADSLEQLDQKILINSKTNSDVTELLKTKDAIRIEFEKSLKELEQNSRQSVQPTCYICFNVSETDVRKWLEQTLVPDLDKLGIKVLFCSRDLYPGDDLNRDFQALIRTSDQVIIVCTPGLKEKCDARKKAPTGVAAEIRLAIERYNDEDKYGTIYPIYLKGNRKSCCPSAFFEPIFGAKFEGLHDQEFVAANYYSMVFRLFGAMRGVEGAITSKIKENFAFQCKNILDGEVDLEALEKWRKKKPLKNKALAKSISNHVAELIQTYKRLPSQKQSKVLINVDDPYPNFVGRREYIRELENCISCIDLVNKPTFLKRVLIGRSGFGKTEIAIKFANDYAFSFCFVGWIDCSSEENIADSYRELLRQFELYSPDQSFKDLRKELHNQFKNTQSPWLLIFDGLNAEDLKKEIPLHGVGLILITSNNKCIWEEIDDKYDQLISVGEMNIEEGMKIFEKVKKNIDQKDLKKLLKRIKKVPYALDRIASLLNFDCNIDGIIKKFEQDQEKALKSLPSGERYDYKKSIEFYWEMLLTRTGQKFTKALKLLGCIDSKKIPKKLLKNWIGISYPKIFTQLEDTLIIYSRNEESFETHERTKKMIKKVFHEELTNSDFVKKIVKFVTKQIKNLKQSNNPDWIYFDNLRIHIYRLLNLASNENLRSEKMQLLEQFIEWLHVWGKHRESLKYAKELKQLIKEDKREGSFEMGKVFMQLGRNYQGRDKIKKAETNFQNALNTFEKLEKNGYDSKDFRIEKATSFLNLSMIHGRYYSDSNSLEGIDNTIKILEKYEEEFDRAKWKLAGAYQMKGLVLWALGKKDEAFTAFLESLVRFDKLSEKGKANSSDHANSYSFVGITEAILSASKGDEIEQKEGIEKGLEKINEGIEIQEQTFTNSAQPYKIVGYFALFAIYERLKEFDKALENLKEVLKIHDKTIKEKTHKLLEVGFFTIYQPLQNSYSDENIEYIKNCLELVEKQFDYGNSIYKACFLHRLGEIYEKKKSYLKAQRSYREAALAYRNVFKKDELVRILLLKGLRLSLLRIIIPKFLFNKLPDPGSLYMSIKAKQMGLYQNKSKVVLFISAIFCLFVSSLALDYMSPKNYEMA